MSLVQSIDLVVVFNLVIRGLFLVCLVMSEYCVCYSLFWIVGLCLMIECMVLYNLVK